MNKVEWRSPDKPLLRENVKNVEKELGIHFPFRLYRMCNEE